MIRNKEIQKFILTEVCFFLITLIIGFFLFEKIENDYERKRIENNAYILSILIETHPELESEIIQAMENVPGNQKKGMEILEKYNLNHLDGIKDLESVEESKQFFYLTQFGFLVAIFLMMSFLYFYFLRKHYQKLEQMNRYLNDVLAGRESLDIRDYEEGDMSSLKNDIYKITTILKEQKENANKDKIHLANTLSDISHQLKTPLTSMYVINDILLDEKASPSQKKELLNKNRKQLERIEWLVTSILKVSRLDSGMVEFKKEEVFVRQLLERVLEPIRIPMELKKQELKITGDESLKLYVDCNWTVEALINIVKNAHEHTPNEGKIEISYFDNPLYTTIFIKDNGSGIKEQDLPHIFERFYKGSGGNKDSIGIGLNMAKMIIDKEQGEIHVTSKEGIGTTFEIKFYKNII